MNPVVSTPDLEEMGENSQFTEGEKTVLNEENSPDLLFRKFGKDGIINIIKGIRLKYQSEEEKEYIKQLIYRIVGEGSDLNWDNKAYVLQKLVTCAAGQNKVVVGSIINVLVHKRNNLNRKSKPELKLYCNITKEYVGLKDAIVYCCSYPEQPIKSFLKL